MPKANPRMEILTKVFSSKSADLNVLKYAIFKHMVELEELIKERKIEDLHDLVQENGVFMKDIAKKFDQLDKAIIKTKSDGSAENTRSLRSVQKKFDDLDKTLRSFAAEIKTVAKLKMVPGPQGEPGDTIVGPQGKQGKDGKDGKDGQMPKHEWNGPFIRFQNQDGSWGEWQNVQGPPGFGGGDMPFGNRGGLERVRSLTGADVQGVSQIIFGSNLVVTKVSDGVIRVDAQGGSSGTSILTERLIGIQEGNFVSFNLDDLSQPWDTLQFITRNGQMQSTVNAGDGSSYYSQSTNTVKVYNADASEIFIFQVTVSS